MTLDETLNKMAQDFLEGMLPHVPKDRLKANYVPVIRELLNQAIKASDATKPVCICQARAKKRPPKSWPKRIA